MKIIKPIFPVPTLEAIIDDYENINKLLKIELDKIFDSDAKRRVLSHKWGNYEFTNERTTFGYSNFDPLEPSSMSDDKNFKFFFDHIAQLITEFFNELGYFDRWHFVNAWAAVYPKGAWVPLHDHVPLHWSGAYYVKTHKNCGNILFHDPKEYALSNEPEDFMFRGKNKSAVEPQDGMLLLFPSYLKHETLPNQEDEDRIIISFNINCDKAPIR